jgi:hypothetical protein
MKTIVLDMGGRFEPMRQSFEDAGIISIVTASPDECLRAYIQHADTDALVLFVEDPGVTRRMLVRLRGINPMFGCFLIAQSSQVFDHLQADIPVTRSGTGLMHESASELAKKILLLDNNDGDRRREHRVAWRLRANLYAHDALDQKIPGTVRISEVVSLSANGAYIATSRVEVDKDSTWLFEISLPDCIFLVKGRVVWINLSNDVPERPRGFALRFEEMSQAPQQFLKLLIETDLVESVLRQAGQVSRYR